MATNSGSNNTFQLAANSIFLNNTGAAALGIGATVTQALTLLGGGSAPTGTGVVVLANTPTFITPVLGAATGTSLAFNPTTGGIIGTTTNDNAGAGKVGELISSVVASGSAVNAASASTINVTSINLTAGDWDVWGNINIVTTQTSQSAIVVWTSATSATQPDNSLTNGLELAAGLLAVGTGFSVPYQRYSLASPTTIYLSQIGFGASGTGTVCGGIYARRVR